jgi:multidrug efflux pump subunit AcrA (membrane-fusion protein)
MKTQRLFNWKRLVVVAGGLVAVVLIGGLLVGGLTYGYWLPPLQRIALGIEAAPSGGRHESSGHAGHAGHADHAGHDDDAGHDDHAGHSHDGHSDVHSHDDDHGHAGHEEADSLRLDEKARRNIGLTTGRVEPRTFVKTVAVPAMVVERPGRSQVEITAPFTGIVTTIHIIEGEAVEPGAPLFEVRLTHEDLVSAQREFLRLIEQLDVTNQEISYLEGLGKDVIAGRRILEKQYEKRMTEAEINAQRQGLLLHGLTEEQIAGINEPPRTLLRQVTVTAPPFSRDEDHHDVDHIYHVQKLNVKRGEQVPAGQQLAVLADHCLLYVEGRAFEDDAARLIAAAQSGRSLRVSPVATGGLADDALSLEVLFVADHVEPESRALRFYLALPNKLVSSDSSANPRFIAWQYRPGQRMEVRVPTAQPWENQLVLPVDAVVQEGAQAFVFEQNGDHFDRVSVHVKHRGKDYVVVDNDGSLVGSTIALSGAYQMHLAIKNRAGGAPDPHAGHNH